MIYPIEFDFINSLLEYNMIDGVVKWFNDAKGFGFVASGGKDYFIHFKEINSPGFKSVKEGDKVSFQPATSPKGLVATCLIVRD